MPQEARNFVRDYVRRARLDYLRYLPPEYGQDPEKKWPLILFLHGAGERGTDINLLYKHGIPRVTREQDIPFVTISPQCPNEHWWSDFLPALDDLLDETLDTLAIDTDRVYLTGISMGGYGAWHLAVEYPDRFAAIAPICGGGPWMYNVPGRLHEIRHMPIWVFHGAKDQVVSPKESEWMVELLKQCGANVRFTLYPEADHDSWTATYNNPELYEWFLQHRREW